MTNPWHLDRIQQATLIVAIVALSLFAARTVERARTDTAVNSASEGALTMSAPSNAHPDVSPASLTGNASPQSAADVPRPEQSPSRSEGGRSEGKSTNSNRVPPSQIMLNSPGGIQAGRDVVISGDAQLIRSIELHLSIETTTASTPTGPEKFDWGLGSVVALFTIDKRRFRFVSDLRVHYQQVAENRRRLRMVYSPETPPEILGQPIAILGGVEVLAANFSEILRKTHFETSLGQTVVECGVILNGIPIGRVSVDVPPGHLNKGQADMVVVAAFSQIPQAYRSATERRQ